MGGLGKTTLAQHVYHDPKMEEAKFDIRAWVCVSDHFDVLTVTKTILEAITNSKDDSGNLEMVHGRLKDQISGRKFLLVLDDVWNEGGEEWEAVRTPLSYGAPGSKILVTARAEKVASNMRSKVHLLRELRGDECWNNNECNIKQLGGLNLHGSLSIKEVQNIVNPLDALEANLKNKHLVNLELEWKRKHIPDDPLKEKKVLENLQPSKHLERLSIENYGGTEFPSWVFNNSLSTLVFLCLENCKYCLCLPPLGLLSSLKTLKIRGFHGIVSIGAEFCGSNSTSFTSLESLEIDNLKEWEEWECKTTFPCLRYLFINRCPKLKGTSEQLLNLKELFVSLRGSRNLRGISNEHTHNHLKEMKIDECPQFESFPSEGLSAPQLWKIEIKGARNLKLLPKRMQILLPSLTELRITDCPQVEMFEEGSLPSNLKEVSLSCFRLIASLREALGADTCLETLSIEEVDVQCFPDEGLLPPSLTSLEIYDCPTLKKLNYKGLSHLSSLRLLDVPT
ncbi:putative disease resistance protein RGA4 [Vigna unguiculata]|uniref:putative disease resistance protein RGA4 n=1 Tax=Vigna unguiculata TaxID=3917 RepID=UPI001016566B|nr:putative disease resistance protein RGA4 [Vigna unguiculata]